MCDDKERKKKAKSILLLILTKKELLPGNILAILTHCTLTKLGIISSSPREIRVLPKSLKNNGKLFFLIPT